MKNTQKKAIVSAIIFGSGIVALAGGLAAVTASAQVAIPTSASANAHAHINVSTEARLRASASTSTNAARPDPADRQGRTDGSIEARSDQEITARISSLNTLSARLGGMKNLSVAEKSTLSAEIATLISQLTALRVKIQTDASSTAVGSAGAFASTSPLRQDFASITKDYRVYALVIPQTEILAAADRVDTLVTSLTTLSAKFQARLGQNTSAAASLQTLADLNIQIANAQTQANAAVSAVSGLTPDNGNTTVAASNEASLKTGRTYIQAATADIQAADKDAHAIVTALEKAPAAGATTTVSSQ